MWRARSGGRSSVMLIRECARARDNALKVNQEKAPEIVTDITTAPTTDVSVGEAPCSGDLDTVRL